MSGQETQTLQGVGNQAFKKVCARSAATSTARFVLGMEATAPIGVKVDPSWVGVPIRQLPRHVEARIKSFSSLRSLVAEHRSTLETHSVCAHTSLLWRYHG